MRGRPLAVVVTALATVLAQPAVAGPALLFDPADGAVLYAEDPDNQWHPASLTKIMTAYLTFEALRQGKLTLNQKISFSANAALQPPSKIGLPVGSTLTVEQALKALIIKSCNDVAVMLAEAVADSELDFVAQMNVTARRLGMTRTTFVNPNGLPAPEQMTTARDLAKLARAAIKDFPEYAAYWAMDDARIGKIRLATHNGLLRSFEGADGMKTGFICDSGFNVVASATRDGHRLMAVVLGEPTGAERTVKAASLLEHGFQQYGWKMLFNSSNIDTMPMAPDAKGIMTIRQSVVSWECGTGRKPNGTRKTRAKGKKGPTPPPGEAAPATKQNSASAGDALPRETAEEVPDAASAKPAASPAAVHAAAGLVDTTAAAAKARAATGFALSP